MSKSIQISMKCNLGESLKPGFSGINMGKYTFSPLPSESIGDFKSELLLNFEDKWKEDQQGLNPKKEGEIILSWLSMILRQKLKVNSSRLNNVQILNTKKEIISFESPIDFPENILDLYNKFKSLSQENLRKFVRACECYQESLLVSTNNPTISFFLFVVCIECLSNKNLDFYQYLIKKIKDQNKEGLSKKEIEEINKEFVTEYGIKNNFIEFILSNFDDWEKEGFSLDEFKKFLSSIYEIRCTFTHEGTNLNNYVKLISKLKSKSVFINIKNRDLEFAGLDYLSKMIRKVLISFLEKQEVSDNDNLPEFALADNIVNLILNEPNQSIKKGSFVMGNQIKHRK